MFLTRRIKWLTVAAALTGISLAHVLTAPSLIWWHVAYQDLCYLPILFAAYWFGVPGGLLAALAAGVGTALHFHAMWADNVPFVVAQYGQAVAFVIAGSVGGMLANAEREANRRQQQALSDLQVTHARLEESHAQLIRADRLSSLGEIAAGLAHEIGNPLAGIKGALEILASRAAPESPEAEFSSLASREVTRLEFLVEEFLDYARARGPRRTRVRLAELVARAESLVAREAADQRLTIATTAEDVEADVDADQLLQVFVNVLLNALQASPAGGHVHVDLALRDSEAVVEFRDAGPGISAENLARVFDPFFSTKKRGTGLGLSISNRIVQAHGGRIEIVQPGHGTIVRVILSTAVPETKGESG